MGVINTTLLVIVGLLIYLIFYRIYGKALEKNVVRADPSRPTPAHRLRDGVDFEPANKYVLFGHHFASIAGVSPIVGPAIAMAWGWLPALLWVFIGNIAMGAVHDYLALMASVRHDGHTIQWIAGELISKRTRKIFEVFILFLIILVIAAFSSVIAKLFVANPSVPTASLLFIIVALLLGYILYHLKWPFLYSTFVGIILLIAAIFLGLRIPVYLNYTSWLLILFIYVIIASSLPVWVLLQPRDYLNAYILWFGLFVGGIVLLLSFKKIEVPAFTIFSPPVIHNTPSPFWPTIPLIIACGALSGFHSMIASGTTSKQLDKEIDALFVGFGAMFTEGFLSTIVIVTIGAFGLKVLSSPSLGPAEFAKNYGHLIDEVGGPVGIFSRSFAEGVSNAFRIAKGAAGVFASLWVTAFALTTLDTTNRIGRLVLVDLLEPLRGKGIFYLASNKWIASTIVSLLGIWLAIGGGWRVIWPAFSGANQLLASIALLTAAIWVGVKLRAAFKYRLLIYTPAIFLWLTVTVALLWFMIKVLPGFVTKKTGEGYLLYMIVGFETLLNILLLNDFLKRLRR